MRGSPQSSDWHERRVSARRTLAASDSRQWSVLAAFVTAGGSVVIAAELVAVRPGTVKRHPADLRARSGLTTERLIYAGRAAGWLVVPALEPGGASLAVSSQGGC